MSTTWFTADEHFGHYNVLQYSNRPFETVHEMNAEIIRRHNEVVGPDDTVVHLGDFTLQRSFNSAVRYLDRLAGREHLFIPGSHDHWLKKMEGIPSWGLPFYLPDGAIRDPKRRVTVLPALSKIMVGNQGFICCHYSLRTWERSHYGTIHLYAHSHGRLPGLGRSMDVGVDCNNLYPFSSDQILERMQGVVAHNAVKKKNDIQRPPSDLDGLEGLDSGASG